MVGTGGKVQELVTLAVRPRGQPIKKLPEEVTIASTAPTKELYEQLAARAGTSIHQLRVTKGSDGSFIPGRNDLLLDSTGLRQQSTIYVKDLGPQIAWQTVFLVEYLGPLLVHPLLYSILPTDPPSYLQSLTLALVMIHFAKRELETLFVHRFSVATMPAFNIFRNSAHYWLLSGVNMAYWVYTPTAAAAGKSNPYITYPGLALFVIGEFGTLSTHITLRNLRSSGGTERGVPHGLGFDLVTCPNYMFETIAWTGIAMISWSLSTLVFMAVAVGFMADWARGKERRYRKEFGGKYQKKSYTMIPGIW